MKENVSNLSSEIETKEIDVTFTNEQDKKEEKYKLFNEEKESLLIKEDLIKGKVNNYQIKISELFQNENTEQYYLNKEKTKEKYLKNLLEIDKKEDDILLNKKDKNEMEILYRETSLKHPRKILNGEIFRYAFCSWTGCFSCQKFPKLEKNEFQQLGLGISSYFKTIKLFILFFFIISCINFIAVAHYLGYTSVIDDNNFFFKTTLGNTKVTTYNAIKYHFDNKELLKLNCYNKKIGKFIYGLELKKPSKVENLYNETEITFKGGDYGHISNDKLKIYNEKITKDCNLTNECDLNLEKKLFDDVFLYYECIDTDLIPENSSHNSLRNTTNITVILTFIILIILYYYYRIAIKIDNDFYHKDKITINNYTLVLRGLKKKSNDFFKELNDLVGHLNNVINSEMNNSNNFEQDPTFFKNNELNNYNGKVKNKNIMNIFDISLSSVNDKKISIIDKIKSLKEEINDIEEGHDTFQKKISHKIFTAVSSVTSLYNQIKNKNKKEEEMEDEEENNEPLVGLTKEENREKIDKTKNKLKKHISKIYKSEIQGLHMDSNKSKYVDIYITFRNPLISSYIYHSYNKTIFQRILLFLTCKIKIIKLFYYKRQWLHFYIPSNAPTNIIWENCYISTKVKYCRRFFTFFISFMTIIISTILISIFTEAEDNASSVVNSYIITGILKVIDIVSSTLLETLTKCEKNSNLTKNITSDIEKYFFLNYAVSTISVNIGNYYTYKSFDSQYSIIMSSILQSMMLSIITDHLSTLAKYLFNLFKRYLDSDFENGKKTKKKKKLEYEELYIGPEFPIGERLSSIFVNLGLCLLYGTSCPLIYLFFTLYLLSTFIVDKILIIHYYKKPPYYDSYFTILTKRILFISIFVYLYGTIYYISNPYLFNYYQNDSIDFGFREIDAYIILNPFTLVFRIWGIFSKISISIYNYSDLCNNYIYLMWSFIVLLILTKFYEFCKKKEKKIPLQNAPNVDIGLVYSSDELSKYYEVKKLELFRFLLNFDKSNSQKFQKYSKLADNYKIVLDYLKQNINFKNENILKRKDSDRNKNIIEENNINTNIIDNNITNTNELIVKGKDENKNDRLLLGDPSYNLAFISNYEIYAYFDLLYCV